ncbi:MAG TPA: alpha/beta hydrolase, partial [Candidatus Limnocylindrales bacterium]
MAAPGWLLAPLASFGPVRRGADRMLAAPRVGPNEAALGPALDRLGGEIVRLRSRDGIRLTARWLDAEPDASRGWRSDPHEAILLLHGYSGSVAPDVLEYGPFLRRTAGVMGLDFRGHGGSDDSPTTFGLGEVEDVAGALAWLGERGITRVGLFGTSLGAITAIEAVAILGDGTFEQADIDPDRPRSPEPAPRPIVVAVVADSASPEVALPVANRIRAPLAGRLLADLLFEAAARRLGADPRATEPGKVVGLVSPVPMLLVHGEADRTVPLRAAQRLAALAGPACELFTVAGADHAG